VCTLSLDQRFQTPLIVAFAHAPLRVAAQLLHNGMNQLLYRTLSTRFFLQIFTFSEWSRGDSNP
jgi:hypothetical protein